MDYVQLLATISLSIQLVVLGLLIGGYTPKRMKKFRQHGITMLTAVALHLIVIFLVMLPSFVSGIIPYASRNAVDPILLIGIVHAVLGTTAAALGVWIVGSWRLRQSLQFCIPKKRIMLATLTPWVIAIILGILLYLRLYTTLLS